MRALPPRAHGGIQFDLARICACSTSVTVAMGIIECNAYDTAMHCNRTWRKQRSLLQMHLTFGDPFVIVVSSTDNPAPPHDDALVLSLFIDPRLSADPAYSVLRYKLYNTAP